MLCVRHHPQRTRHIQPSPSRGPGLTLLLLVLPLAAFALTGIAAPAGAAGPVFALEGPLLLPPESDLYGHTPPGVALLDDGSFLAVWSDLSTGRVIGRRYEPPSADGESESTFFDLSGDDTSKGPVELAQGGDDLYLAAWGNLATGPDSEGISVRAFDGQGTPVDQPFLVVDQRAAAFALDARPSGGFALAWWIDDSDPRELRLRILGSHGEVVGGSVQVATAAADGTIPTVRLAVEPGGTILVTWSYRSNGSGQASVLGRVYSAVGAPLDPATTLVPPADGGFPVGHDVAATGPGTFLLAWAPPVSAGTPPGSILTRPFDASLAPTGPAHTIAGGEGGNQVLTLPALAVDDSGRGIVAWSEKLPPTEASLRARLVDADGTTRSGTFEVIGPPLVSGNGFGGINRIRLDRNDAGRMVVGWGLSYDSGLIPTEENVYYTVGARRYAETDPACHPVLTTDFRTEPAQPAAGEDVRLVFEGLADCAQLSLTGWDREAGGVHVDVLAEGQGCGTVPPFPFNVPVDAGSFDAGSYQASYDVALPGGGTCTRQYGFDVMPGEDEPPPEPPDPPDAPPLTSSAVPGFEVWVKITPQAGPVILGGASSSCIPETLCVSGALPDRPEVFVRVVGPKPNGYLWPTLVKFSTSTVEVWIEQVATGQVRYYRLEGATPGHDELPGLFDRTGFQPQ